VLGKQALITGIHNMALQIPGEIDALAALSTPARLRGYLIAIRDAAVIFPP
jgi:hypothetical protein